MHSKDAKDDEESATDQDNVANGFERRKQGLDDQLQSRSSIDDSEGSQGSDQAKDSEDSKDLVALAQQDHHDRVKDGHNDQGAVHDVPARLEVGLITIEQTGGHGLEKHLNGEDHGEDVIEYVQELSLKGPGRDVGSLHGQGDAVGGDKDEDDKVKVGFVGDVDAPESELVTWRKVPQGIVGSFPLELLPNASIPRLRRKRKSRKSSQLESTRLTCPVHCVSARKVINGSLPSPSCPHGCLPSAEPSWPDHWSRSGP